MQVLVEAFDIKMESDVKKEELEENKGVKVKHNTKLGEFFLGRFEIVAISNTPP